jgi:hypothetical protein
MTKKKLKPNYPWYEIIECPICKSKTFEYVSYSEECHGVVEQHGFCHRCGYIVEQGYSPVYEAFWDTKRGFRRPDGRYIPKNVKKHKRIRRKKNIKNIEVNPIWINYV